MTNTITPRWHTKRTAETRDIEQRLLQAGFAHADAYRYNPAAIRVRIIDPTFEGLNDDERENRVDQVLKTLPPSTQADITMLLTFAPSDVQSMAQHRAGLLNLEFDDPSPSML